MRRGFIGCLLFLIFHSSLLAYPKLKPQKESLQSGGRQRTYYLFVPESASKASHAPLLVMFHGSGRNGMSLIDEWQELASREGIILAAPDSADPRQWSPQENGPDFVHDVVDAVKSKYPIDAKRIYVFGHSAGAVYALYLSLIESEYFAAATVHAGALAEQDIQLMEKARRKIPIGIWVGTKDQYFSLADVRATRDALNARGFPVQLHEMPGADHNYYSHSSEINKAAWDFLNKYELRGEPKYQHYD